MSARAWIGVAVAAIVMAAGIAIWLGSRSSGSPASGWNAKPADWSVQGRPSGRIVEIGVESGKCLGQPMPRLIKTEVIESDEQVSVGATIEEFAFSGLCAGVGLYLSQTIVLAEPLGDRRLLDPSEDPPVQRWPREQ